jgi:hypothetical protein
LRGGLPWIPDARLLLSRVLAEHRGAPLAVTEEVAHVAPQPAVERRTQVSRQPLDLHEHQRVCGLDAAEQPAESVAGLARSTRPTACTVCCKSEACVSLKGRTTSATASGWGGRTRSSADPYDRCNDRIDDLRIPGPSGDRGREVQVDLFADRKRAFQGPTESSRIWT